MLEAGTGWYAVPALVGATLAAIGHHYGWPTSLVLVPGTWPSSTSAWRTQARSQNLCPLWWLLPQSLAVGEPTPKPVYHPTTQ